MPKKYKKHPVSLLDYTFDWGDEWLGADTISAYEVTATNCTLDADSSTTTAVTVWIDGGSLGIVPPSVSCTITTAAGREDTRTILFDMTIR
jgi:hypothetical protein